EKFPRRCRPPSIEIFRTSPVCADWLPERAGFELAVLIPERRRQLVCSVIGTSSTNSVRSGEQRATKLVGSLRRAGEHVAAAEVDHHGTVNQSCPGFEGRRSEGQEKNGKPNRTLPSRQPHSGVRDTYSCRSTSTRRRTMLFLS